MAVYESGLTYNQLRKLAESVDLEHVPTGGARKNGASYQAFISYRPKPTPTCEKPKRVYLYRKLDGTKTSGRDATGKTELKSRVAAWREQVIVDAKRVAGIGADPTSSVRSCIEQYIESKVDVGEIRASSATYYRDCGKRIYRYPFASMPLKELTTSTVQKWVADLSKTCAGRTVRGSFSLLDAVCRKMLGAEHNPCEGVTLPKVTHNAKTKSSRPNALTLDGLARVNGLLDELDRKAAANNDCNVMALGARIALNTGMRTEEVCGLRWRDVDLDNGTISVVNIIERAWVPVKDEYGNPVRDAKGNIKAHYSEYPEAPKTDNSERDIPLTAAIRRLLEEHRARTVALLEKLEPNPRKRPEVSTLYVLGGADGSFLSPRTIGNRWGYFMRKNDIRGTADNLITFHDLRHTAATRMIAAGIDVATVSHLLGHAETSVTVNKYVTSDDATKRAAIDRMEDIFNVRKEGSEGVDE